MRPLRILSVVLLFANLGWASTFGSSDAGTTTADFLKLGVGARAEAMGEAYSAAADDASALYWNPAALTQIPEKTASAMFMHAPYIASTYYDYGAYAQNMGRAGAWGAGIQYFSAGSITQTDRTGTDLGSFTPYDLAASLGYANQWKDYSFGMSAKFIRSQIIDSAQTAAVDFGVLSPAYFNEKLRLAFTADNIGGDMKFLQESDPLPLAFKVGSAYKITTRWTATVDGNFPSDSNPYLALGTEYRYPIGLGMTLAGRAGFNSLTAQDVPGTSGFSLGFGFELRALSIDYALVPIGDLGLTHRISLSFRFNAPDFTHNLVESKCPPDSKDPACEDLYKNIRKNPTADTYSTGEEPLPPGTKYTYPSTPDFESLPGLDTGPHLLH